MDTTQPTGRRRQIVGAGWLCFGLGMALMFASLGAFFLYGPLFLAAFVLSIVAIAQSRVAAGIVLLLSTAAVPTVTWFGLLAYHVGETRVEAEQKQQAALANVEFEGVKGYIDGKYMYCEGAVRNTGSGDVDYVKVRVEWLDDTGTVLDTDWTYAVSGDALRPGGAKSFRIMTPADRRMKQFRYSIEP